MAKEANFKRMPKEATTEPSVDEVSGGGMKRGGKARMHKLDGGMAANPAVRRPVMAPVPRGKVVVPRPTIMRKEGGETKSEHKAEMKKMSKVESELKAHEKKPASKAHKGLKVGGLLGGVVDYKAHNKGQTGGIEGPGYKKGGRTCKADGGKIDKVETRTTLKPKINVNDKVVTAKQTKSLNTKTRGVEGAGYKKGGLAGRYLNNMQDASKPHTKKGATGEIKQKPAGYKDGGHVFKAMGGSSNGHKTMKKGGCF